MKNVDGLHPVVWHPLAEQDLYLIVQFIALDNPVHAKNFGESIENKIQTLQHHPLLGRAGTVTGARELVVHSNYVVIYQVEESYIQILRIKHAAQGWFSWFCANYPHPAGRWVAAKLGQSRLCLLQFLPQQV